MRKKLDGNGIWESSRMMLPEHKERIRDELHQQDLHDRPILAEDEREDINRAISESLYTGARLALLMYDPIMDFELTGIVTKIDQQLQRLKLERDGEIIWLPFEDVLAARIAE